MKILKSYMQEMQGTVIDGDMVFKLKDTYGFPDDLTADIAREKGLTIDKVKFDQLLAQQQASGREQSGFEVDYNDTLELDGDTSFVGYEHLENQSVVTDIVIDGNSVDAITSGTEAGVVLNETPFYAESGGQVGDQGIISGEGFEFEFEAYEY